MSNAPTILTLDEAIRLRAELNKTTKYELVNIEGDGHKTLIRVVNTLLNEDIYVYSDKSGANTYIQMLSDIKCVKLNFRQLVALTTKRLVNIGVYVKARDVRDLCESWTNESIPVSDLPPSFTLNPKERAFHHISLHIQEGPSPTWDDFIERCGKNGPSLMAFVWSIFERSCKSEQYLFLRGDGQNGKGTFTKWLQSLVGDDNFSALTPQNRYWPSMCVSKRLGFFDELNNTSFMMSESFKKITGGDPVTVEEKYEQAYTIRLDVKLILSSNNLLNISGGQAERRRVILVDIEIGKIPDYVKKIHEEGPAFLFKCREAYQRLYNTETNRIECDYTAFDEQVDGYEEPLELLFSRCFKVNAKKRISAVEFQNAIHNAGHRYRDNNLIGNFKAYIKRKYGIKKQYLTVNGERRNYYMGLELKETNGTAFNVNEDDESNPF